MRLKVAMVFIGILAASIIAIIPSVATDSEKPMHMELIAEQIPWQQAAGQENVYTPIEQIPLDADLQEYMEATCRENNLSYAFALMVMESESDFDANAVGDEGRSIGYFQINQINWERMATEYGYDVQDPRENIAAGVAILTELFEKYEDPYMVLLCYKCGETRGKELYAQEIYITKQFDCNELCKRAREIEGYME